MVILFAFITFNTEKKQNSLFNFLIELQVTDNGHPFLLCCLIDPYMCVGNAGQTVIVRSANAPHQGYHGTNMQPVSGTTYVPPSTGYAPPGAGYAPPGAGYAPPGAGYAPPGAGYAPPAAGYAQPAAGYPPPAAVYPPPTAGYPPPPTAGYPPPAAGYTTPAAGCAPPPAGYVPPSAGCAPPPAGYAPNPTVQNMTNFPPSGVVPTSPPSDMVTNADNGNLTPPPLYNECVHYQEKK